MVPQGRSRLAIGIATESSSWPPVWQKGARRALKNDENLRLRGEPSDDVTEFVNRNALNVGEPFVSRNWMPLLRCLGSALTVAPWMGIEAFVQLLTSWKST